MRNEFLKSEVVGQKRGIPVYTANPSIPDPSAVTRIRRKPIGDETKGFVVDGAGAVIGRGVAAVYEWEEVDQERFVKLYLDGLKQAAGLSKAGLAVLELVYNELRSSHGRDTVTIAFATSGLKKSTYYDGLRQLLEKEFLFRSPLNETFFVNIRFMFNGDRLAFIKGYRLKGSAAEQPSLPLLEPYDAADPVTGEIVGSSSAA
jgi:hypothetical protein